MEIAFAQRRATNVADGEFDFASPVHGGNQRCLRALEIVNGGVGETESDSRKDAATVPLTIPPMISLRWPLSHRLIALRRAAT